MGATGLVGVGFLAVFSSVMPDLIRHPASPGPWAEKSPPAAQTRVGWFL